MPSGRSRAGADRQHDGVVELAQLGERHASADLDVAVEVHQVPQRGPFELLGDLLGALVIGSDARADQPERRRQTLDDVDPHIGGFVQQRFGGVEAGRTGADDGDRDRHPSAPPRVPPGCASRRSSVARSRRLSGRSSRFLRAAAAR